MRAGSPTVSTLKAVDSVKCTLNLRSRYLGHTRDIKCGVCMETHLWCVVQLVSYPGLAVKRRHRWSLLASVLVKSQHVNSVTIKQESSDG